jgi:hypothetical protein
VLRRMERGKQVALAAVRFYSPAGAGERTRTTYDTATAVFLHAGVRSIDVRRASDGAYVAGGEQLLQSHSPIEGEWAR